ncbi:MAG: virulence factor SrfC family protein [Aestuariivita sp.]|nr:virulence factor SrfC family protein [Aestuariivita sp.]
MTEKNPFANRCEDVARISREAIDWINNPENAELVGMRKKNISTHLRRSARRAERLERSAKTKMSVSVFGPSQAGKSFLVSILARPQNGRLVADFDDPEGKLDYIAEINPAGDGESTGLVTRFTTTKTTTPPHFPIQLNLLTESDIVRILINSFFEDGDQSEHPPDSDFLKSHFEQHGRIKHSSSTGGFSFEEVYEIQDYVDNFFGKTAYAAGLKGFWEEAAELIPNMTPDERGALLSITWGGYVPLTELYVKLAKALSKINHSEVIFVQLAAIQPRETSIIDVNTLAGLFVAENEDMLSVQTADGQTRNLNRAIITALAAELVLPMLEQPSEFFSETDLLDFPGARNRFEQPLSVTLEKPEETLVNLLLRGKVAYLFDRYVENQEITSMLLCVPDSNMETLSLPNLINRWIELTHGITPDDRAKTDCILFFVLTKFDKHLIDSASAAEDYVRFERRMDASLLKGFGKISTSWVHQWTNTKPFENCFWLRNPYYPIEALIDYEDGNEISIIPEKIDRIAELKAGCLQVDAVQTHFKDPARAWESALELNDGGASYLVEELTKVCKPQSKINQIGIQIEAVASEIHRELTQFYVSSDIEKYIEEKREAAMRIIDGLELTLSNHRFGAFLNALSVDQETIQYRISRVPASIRIRSATTSEAITQVTDTNRPTKTGASVQRPRRPGALDRPTRVVNSVTETKNNQNKQEQKNPTIQMMTPEVFQAETAINIWIETLKQLRDDENQLKIFQLNQEIAGELVNELIYGINRIGIRDQIIQDLKKISFGLTVDRTAPSASIVCSERINDFVATLGANQLPRNQVPRIDLGNDTTRLPFEPRTGANTADKIPAQPRSTANETWTDWVYMLESLFVENAKEGQSETINIEQNLRVGNILSRLEDKVIN